VEPHRLALSYAEITEADVPELTGAMTRAFDDDAQRHLGQQRGGPPGYDNGDFSRTWLFPYKESVGFKILADGKIIGALIVWILPGDHNNLGAMFVDPPHQDQGVGTRAWQFIDQGPADPAEHDPTLVSAGHDPSQHQLGDGQRPLARVPP
jgi:GNAT superfamily N-acetyltransferase